MIPLSIICFYKGKEITSVYCCLLFFFLQGLICQSYGDLLINPDQEMQKYCTNIADLVRERNYLSNKKALEDLQKKVEDLLVLLENRKNEYDTWFKKYDNFISSYNKNILDIYKKMDSDSAAIQLEKIDPAISSHILMRLIPRQSSLIMSKMDPRYAAIITDTVANMLKFKKSKR
ncbi:MAG: hypothetical protein C4617_01570 [Candidatus Liberibacter europaeus]|uniref:Flagellar protein n=1 Tax=Candidatus Liberibacter europaeus TaxID=744859 RepID=A0A2T4VXM9_9HYPH|nr:hypothetical protein [Candidatus Liberibacter europaeus]PTL86537.1 MAG: hypothetical protein C4617_01570 [Candidatus Liberibacter europaeus]